MACHVVGMLHLKLTPEDVNYNDLLIDKAIILYSLLSDYNSSTPADDHTGQMTLNRTTTLAKSTIINDRVWVEHKQNKDFHFLYKK